MQQVTQSAVLDTNVVLDWLVFRDAAVAPLAQAVESGRLRWLATAGMRRELAHMLVHRSLESWSPDCERALAVFDALAIQHAAPSPSRLLCRDADDQMFIDLALAQQAQWLLTRDKALLRLARAARGRGLAVCAPAAWAAAAAAQGGG